MCTKSQKDGQNHKNTGVRRAIFHKRPSRRARPSKDGRLGKVKIVSFWGGRQRSVAVSEAKLIMCRKFILNCSAINLNILNQCKIPKEFARTLVLFCRDLMNVLKWNIYSCFKEAVMMQWNSTGGGRIEWHLNKMAQSRGRLREGKNWASIIEVKIHGIDEKCEQSFISVLFRARRGSRPCTECQSLGEKIKFPPCIYFNWHDTSQIMPFLSSINVQARTTAV